MHGFQKTIKFYLIVMLVAVLCFAPLSAQAWDADEYVECVNVDFKGENIKILVSAPAGVFPEGTRFVSESPTTEALGIEDFDDQYLKCEISDAEGNLQTELEEGKFAKLYVQIPNGMTTEVLQRYIIAPAPGARYDVAVEVIDGLQYLTFKTNNFEMIIPVPAGEEEKIAAKEEIAGYKDPADYKSAQKRELKKIIDEANAEIDAARTVDEVNAAVAKAKNELDKVKTADQIPNNTPQMGDESMMGLWIGLMAMAFAACVMLWRRKQAD